MPVDDLGDYDVAPVEGNPFGAMADSPNNYDVAPVDHDPFAGAGENPAPDQFELASRQPEPTPSSAGGPPLDPSDRDLLIKTVYGEASGEPALGQAGVTHAILNRVRAGGYGQGIAGVVKAPVPNPRDAARGYHEFSPWNTGRATEGNPTAQHLSPNDPNPVLARAYRNIGDVVDKAYSGLIPDQTGGATHYYGRMRGHPSWSPPLAALNTVKIGNTTFVGREHGPGQSLQTAGFADGGGIDDDPSNALNTTQESDNGPEGVPAVAARGPAVEGDWSGQSGTGRVGQGYPAGPSEGQPGGYLGALGGGGLRPGGGGTQDFVPAEPDAFHQAISAAKAAHPAGAQVALYSPEEYAQTRPFLSADGKSGFALNDDDIISVFRHPEAQQGNVAKRALKVGVANGGQRLDAFDTYLPKIYSSAGFKPVARLPFSDQFAPEGWDYEQNKDFNGGRPDVVFMVHDPENASHIGGKPVASYEEGVAAQREALKEVAARAPKPLMPPQVVGRPPVGLIGEEEHLQRQREGLEEGDRPLEWTGGRIGFAGGGAVLPPWKRFQTGGPVQLNDDLRRRLELMTQPRHGLADGGVTDLGSSDDVDLTAPDPFAESGVGATPPEAEPPPDLAEAARAGKLGTISSYTPSWSEQIRYGTQEGLKALGAERGFAEDVGQNLSDIAGYTPGVGNVLSGNEAYRSYEGGHPYLAALHAAAAVPIPGVKGATKAVENVAENVAEKAAVPSSIRVAKQLRRGRGAQPLPEETSVFAPEGLPESGIGPAPPSALGGWAKAGDPEVVWDPERKGWNLTGRNIEKGFEPTTLFDRPEPMDVPPVPQFELPRYEPARGVPQRTLDITSDPAVRAQHLALIRRGMDMGALAWYNAEPIRQRFLQELGQNEGQASFQNFMDMVASTSPQQKVPENVRAASYYYWLNQNKLPVPERGTVPKIAYGGGQPVESPYGGLSLWQMNVNRVMNEGGLNPLENPKPPSFSQNLQGNWAPATVDMHAVLAPAILARHPGWLTKEGKTLLNSGTSMDELAGNPKWWDSAPGQNEYPTLERYYQSLANQLGITPAQAQAASWVGAGHITGLGSDGNKIFSNFFEDRIANTAAKTGKPPQEVLSNFIRGRHPLLSVAPLGALPFVASSRQTRTQGKDRPAED